MRNFTRVLAAALFCGALFSAAFVGAQEATETPAPPVDATAEVTPDMPVEMTSEPTMEMTMEATAEMTTAPTTESGSSSTQATAAPATEMTAEATTDNSTGSTTTTTNTNGMVTCNSDLILNLYVAERYFGFSSVVDAAKAGDTTGTSAFVDLTTLDKGQYTPLFNNLMNMMATNSMLMPGAMMTQDQIQMMGGMMNMDQTAMANQMATMMPPGTDMSSMTTLAIATLPGEPDECTMLRAELNRFYSLIAFNDMQTSMGASSQTSAGTGSTAASMNFATTLAGANEVPGPGDTDGTGTAALTVDMANNQVCYTLSVQNITLPAVAAHIHRGPVGVAGPVVIPFDLVPDASGNATSCVKADPALLNEIATNPAGFYVNVHTSDFPNGAVRGQVSG